MALKAPGTLTFVISILLTVAALVVLAIPSAIPFFKDHGLWILLAAHSLLILGCVMRGL